MTGVILLAVIWIAGWLTFVFVNEPDEPMDAALLLICGVVIWPFYFIGWLISRPFQY